MSRHVMSCVILYTSISLVTAYVISYIPGSYVK